MSTGLVGAIRERLADHPAAWNELPGRVYANELPAGKGQLYPAVVVRWPRSRFQHFTSPSAAAPSVALPGERSWVMVPQLELWIECLDAADGERLAGLVLDALCQKSLTYSPGSDRPQVVQLLPVNFFLDATTRRNAAGEPQYSWCLELEALVSVNRG